MRVIIRDIKQHERCAIVHNRGWKFKLGFDSEREDKERNIFLNIFLIILETIFLKLGAMKKAPNSQKKH